MSPLPSARRSTISVAALIGALALLFSGLAPVSATESSPNIDPDATGSITIHKFAEQAEVGDAGHKGNELPSSATENFEGLDGVGFTISRVNGFDLRKAADWQRLEGLTASSVVDSTDIETVTTVDGVAKTSELPLGVYLVTETASGENNIVEPVDPFLVSVPTAGPDNAWLYDIHAYPKNSVVTVDMVADDSQAFGMNGTGDITWEIKTAVPYMPEGRELNTFAIKVDVTDHLALSEDAEENIELFVGEQKIPRETYSATVADGILTVSPPEGAGALNAFQGQEIRLVVATKMTANSDRKGIVAANATVVANDAQTIPVVAKSDWGAARIITTAGNDPLPGVKYKITRTASAEGEAISVSGRTEFETDANGELVIEGLRVDEQFYLVETGTPPGYASAKPYPFTVVPADTSTVTGSDDAPNVFTVPKEQVSGFALPITGSFGSLPFLLAGLLLVVTALIVNRSRRRRLARAV